MSVGRTDFYPGVREEWDDTTNPYANIRLSADAYGIQIAESAAQTKNSLQILDSSGNVVWGILGTATTGTQINLAPNITSGNGLSITSNAITTGNALKIASTSALLTSANLLNVSITSSSLTLAAVTGDTVKVATSMTNTALSGTVAHNFNTLSLSKTVVQNGAGGTTTHAGAVLSVTLVSTQTAGTLTDSSNGLSITFPAAVSGNALLVTDSGTTHTVAALTANALTTGTVLAVTANALTTGTGVSVSSSSADTTARFLAILNNSNAAAIGVVPLKIINAAVQGTGSKFVPMIRCTEGTKVTTIWLSIDATSPNTALSGIVGDICLNGPSGRSFYCTGTTNWTASNA